jgi:hypothetical protein
MTKLSLKVIRFILKQKLDKSPSLTCVKKALAEVENELAPGVTVRVVCQNTLMVSKPSVCSDYIQWQNNLDGKVAGHMRVEVEEKYTPENNGFNWS